MRRLALSFFLSFLILSFVAFSDAGWKEGYQYRRIIEIDNFGNSDSLTDYQVLLTIAYDSNMQADFDDLRFEDESANELSYWIQKKDDSNLALVWVKLSVASNTTTNIYMYYGNSLSLSQSNIDETMIFGDDFDDDSFDDLKWNTDANSGSTVEDNGVLNVTCGYADDSSRRHYSDEIFDDVILEGRMKIDDVTNTQNHQYHLLGLSNELVWWTDDLASAGYNEDAWVGTPFVRYNTRNDGSYSGTVGDNPSDFEGNVWSKFKIVKSDYFVGHYKDDLLKYNHTSNVPDETMFVLLATETGQNGDTSSDFWTVYDWVFVRKYTPLEPTYSIGPEESNPDSDGDGVLNYMDWCPDTQGEALAHGCSCEQILEIKPGKSKGLEKKGCSEGTIKVFESIIGWTKFFS